MAQIKDNSTNDKLTLESSGGKTVKGYPFLLKLGCLLLVTAAALHSADCIVGGGDTWVAMACGRYTTGPWAAEQDHRAIQMKALDPAGVHLTQQDFLGEFSRPFNPESRNVGNILRRCGWAVQEAMGKKPDKTGHEDIEDVGWINQNWLTHVTFYSMKALGVDDPMAENAFGESLIVLYKFIQAILTALFAYWAARELGAHPLIAALIVAFGVLLSRSFIDLRPNISSILYAIITIYLLARWRNGNYKAMFWMIPVMLLWANVHGGFIYAMMVFALAGAAYAVHAYAGRWMALFLLAGLFVLFVIIMSAAGSGTFSQIINESQQDIEKLQTQKFLLGMQYKDPKNNMSKLDYEDRLEMIDLRLNPLFRQERAIHLTRAFAIIASFCLLGVILCASWQWKRRQSPAWFYPIERRAMKYLAMGGAFVVFIPWFFSPFGLENLVHPLLVATGDEGTEWRAVAEWLPIWQMGGFGNVRFYILFLMLLGLTVAAWWILRLRTTPPAMVFTRRRTAPEEPLSGPKVDLAHLAIIAITVAMSIQSRRFIFLGGIIVAPFLAAWITEVINMALDRRTPSSQDDKPIVRDRVWVLLSWATAGVLGVIFVACLWDTYYRAPVQGPRLSMFRRMVGIPDQPVEAMAFVNANHLRGVVLNEWTHGGFVAFSQTPDPVTGEPPCKPFMDGRAQAAYDIDHFRLQNSYRMFPKDMDIERFHEKLQTKKINLALLDNMSKSSDNLQSLFDRSPRWKRLFTDHRYILYADFEHPLNADVVKAYHEDKMIWPDEILQNYNRGLYEIYDKTPAVVRQGFERLISLQTDEYLPNRFELTWAVAKHLSEQDKARAFFQRELKRRLDVLESGERFHALDHIYALHVLLHILENDAREQGLTKQSQQYQQQSQAIVQQLKAFRAERKGLLW